MIPRILASLLVALCLTTTAVTLSAQPAENDGPPLVGRVKDKTYISPTGTFKVEIPVLPELGGHVIDTPNVVTFQDDFSVHVSIACFKMDATQRWENETRGRKDYLVWFFSTAVLPDFQERYPGSKIETAKFRSGLMDGALFTYTSLPGGSTFADRVVVAGADDVPVAKRGNLLFVKDEYIFVLSVELAEKVLERTTWKKTADEENEILAKRLTDLLNKVTFTAPAKSEK